MGDVKGDGEWLSSQAGPSVRVSVLVWGTGRIGLQLELGMKINIRARARLRFRVMLTWG